MRLALVIEGNAAGAKQALDDTARGLAAVKQSVSALGPAESAVFKGFTADLSKATSAINDMSKVGQGGLDAVRARFDPLFAAGQQYKQQLGDIRDAVAIGALTQTQGAQAIQTTKEAFTRQVAAIKQTGGAVQGLSFEAKNLSFQLIDVAQGALSGQSAFMIMAQQGGQLAQVIAFSPGGLGGLMKELKGAVAGLLTPMRLLAVGAVAVGVAAFALNSIWKSSALALDDTARAAGTTVRVLRELQSAAAAKGIDRNQFLPDMEKFGAQVYQARDNLGGLAEVFRANGIQAKGFEDSFNKAADLIARARDDQQRLSLLQQMGLPATMEYVRFMQQGADGIKKAREEAGAFGGVIEDAMIRKARDFDEAWNKAWAAFGNSAQGAVVAAKAKISDLINDNAFKLLVSVLTALPKAALGAAASAPARPADRIASGFREFKSNFPGEQKPLTLGTVRGALGMSEKEPVDPEKLKRQIALEQQRIGILGQTAAVSDQVRAVELQIQQARLAGVRISGEQEATLKRLAADQALGITQIRAGADAYRLEGETIGMAVGQSTAYLAAQNAILEAKRRGQELSPGNIAAIQAEADALGRAAQRTDDMKSSYDVAKGALSTFRSEMQQNGNVWDAFAKAGITALDKVTDKLVDLAFNSAWKLLFNAGTGGGGGLLTSIASIFGFAQGGYTGDHATDAVAGVVHGKEFVVKAAATARHRPLLEAINRGAPGYADGGFVGPPPNGQMSATSANDNGRILSIKVSIDLAGANGDKEIERIATDAAATGVRTGLREYDRALPDRIRELNARGM